MKILRILLIILVPAMGIVGCKKSEVKPVCNPAQENQASVVSSEPSSDQLAGRPIARTDSSAVLNGDDNNPVEIYGSGDDDRDGGDKKPKKR